MAQTFYLEMCHKQKVEGCLSIGPQKQSIDNWRDKLFYYLSNANKTQNIKLIK